jgi:hypothetical protein
MSDAESPSYSGPIYAFWDGSYVRVTEDGKTKDIFLRRKDTMSWVADCIVQLAYVRNDRDSVPAVFWDFREGSTPTSGSLTCTPDPKYKTGGVGLSTEQVVELSQRIAEARDGLIKRLDDAA